MTSVNSPQEGDRNLAPKEASRPDVVHLDIRGKGKSVVVTPDDQDRFMLKVEKAIGACQLLMTIEAGMQRFSLLLKRLGEWVSKRTDSESAWLSLRDGQMLFLVVRKSASYDPRFEDELSSLELEIANDADLGMIPMSTMAMPRASQEALCSFMDPSVAFHFAPADASS